MLVEDDEELRARFEQALEARGLTVHSATDGQAAVKKLSHNEVDLIILDLDVNEGISYLQELVSIKPRVRVVTLTDFPNYKWDFRTWAADALFIKSSDVSQVESTVENILHDRQHQSGS